MLQSLLGLGSVDIRPRWRTWVLAGICPSGQIPTTGHTCKQSEKLGRSNQVRGIEMGNNDQCYGRPYCIVSFFGGAQDHCAQASGRPVEWQEESTWSRETASPCSEDSMTKTTFLTSVSRLKPPTCV